MKELGIDSSLFIVKLCPQDLVLGKYPLFAKYLISLSIFSRFKIAAVQIALNFHHLRECTSTVSPAALLGGVWNLVLVSMLVNLKQPCFYSSLWKGLRTNVVFYRLKPLNGLQQGSKNGAWNFFSVALAKVYFNGGEKIYLLFFPFVRAARWLQWRWFVGRWRLGFSRRPLPLGHGVDLKRRFSDSRLWELKSRL